MLRSSRICLAAVFLAIGGGAAAAQSGPGLGTVIDAIEPEREMGLPTMAPQAPEELVVPPTPAAPAARPAAPRPAAPAASAPAPAPAAQAAAAAGSWVSECLEGAQTGQACQAIVRSAAGEQTVLVLSLARSQPDAVAMQMALPLGFAVQRGAQISIADFSTVLPVSRCTAQGCLIESAVAEPLLYALQSGASGTVTVHTVDGEAIGLPLPGDGAAAAFEAAGLVPSASQ